MYSHSNIEAIAEGSGLPDIIALYQGEKDFNTVGNFQKKGCLGFQGHKV